MKPKQRNFAAIAAVLGALAVILGAFGAHLLKNALGDDMMAIYNTGIQYHVFHALALLTLALGTPVLWESRLTQAVAWTWLVGVLIFSGSLYLLAITDQPWLGAITPIGGVAFIIGWALLAVTILRVGTPPPPEN